MKINLTEMMRIKGRLADVNSEMGSIFKGINANFEDISRNINSSGLQEAINNFQNNVTALAQRFEENMRVLDTFIGDQLSTYTITNEEVNESLKALIQTVDNTFDKDGNIITTYSASVLATSAPVVGAGVEIAIPTSVRQTGLCRNYTSYSYFYDKWTQGTAQREIANQWGEAGKTSSNGIATLNDRYLVAVSPKFGKVGDNIDVVLSDGQVIHATIADMKGNDATSEWGHVLTNSGAVDIIEWEATGAKEDINLGNWGNVTVDRIVNITK